MKRVLFLTVFLLLLTYNLFSQTGSITGIVYDKISGVTLSGVDVLIESTTQKSVTDLRGNFLISGPNYRVRADTKKRVEKITVHMPAGGNRPPAIPSSFCPRPLR